MRVLVTGAAGFIGASVARRLEGAGHEVLRADAFIPQAHATPGGEPAAESEHVVARVDVRNADSLLRVLRGVEVVCHQAAMVGAGIAPSDLPLFASHNDLGTATLLSVMAEAGVTRLLLASSMVVYGDGRYDCPRHGPGETGRSLDDLRAGRFDLLCPRCGDVMDWRLVDEGQPLDPRSGYAASKVAQEHYARAWARQTGGSVIALRYHNVYGPGMPANTPYSGVAALFRSAVEEGQPPRVFEDGAQMRDFVHVDDVATANLLSLQALVVAPAAGFEAYNVCSGTPVSIADVAAMVADGVPGRSMPPVVTGEFRPGDVRHIVASPEKARHQLGFAATVHPEQGLRRFARDPLRPAGSATTR